MADEVFCARGVIFGRSILATRTVGSHVSGLKLKRHPSRPLMFIKGRITGYGPSYCSTGRLNLANHSVLRVNFSARRKANVGGRFVTSVLKICCGDTASRRVRRDRELTRSVPR